MFVGTHTQCHREPQHLLAGSELCGSLSHCQSVLVLSTDRKERPSQESRRDELSESKLVSSTSHSKCPLPSTSQKSPVRASSNFSVLQLGCGVPHGFLQKVCLATSLTGLSQIADLSKGCLAFRRSPAPSAIWYAAPKWPAIGAVRSWAAPLVSVCRWYDIGPCRLTPS